MSGSPSAVVLDNPQVPGGYLNVFHQGLAAGQLWGLSGVLAGQDDINWSKDTLIPNVGLGGSPLAVAWLGGITVFHQGEAAGQLWYTYSSDGINWGKDTLVPNVDMQSSPGCVVLS